MPATPSDLSGGCSRVWEVGGVAVQSSGVNASGDDRAG